MLLKLVYKSNWTVVMVAYCEHTPNHLIVYFKWVNGTAHELYLKSVAKEKKPEIWKVLSIIRKLIFLQLSKIQSSATLQS